MEKRRWTRRTAWGGGIAIGTGIVLFALFSNAGGSCTANVIVLSDGVVGPHGCAVTSIAAHAGIGLLVLGAALLIGACLLAVVGRTPRAGAVSGDTARSADGSTDRDEEAERTGHAAVGAAGEPLRPSQAPEQQPVPPQRPVPVRPEFSEPAPEPAAEIEPVVEAEPVAEADESEAEPAGEGEQFVLPPGWYGNPENRNGSVQWWDGHRLVDRPPTGPPLPD